MPEKQAVAGDENVRKLSNLGSRCGAQASGKSEGGEVTDINKAIIRGRAAADASVKHLTNSTLVTLRVCTDGSYQGKDGRMVERVDWHMIACWGKVAEQAQSVRKGSVVHVEGEIRTRSYDKGGEKRYVTEIVASKIVCDSVGRVPQIERDDVPERPEDDIPF